MTRPGSSRLLTGLQSLVLGVVVLYFGRPVLVPLVIAILFTMLLRPPVLWLERRRLRRVPAVVLVAVTIGCVLLGLGWTLTRQIHQMGLHLDEYRGHMRARVQALQGSRIKSVENVKDLLKELSTATPSAETDAKDQAAPRSDPAPFAPDPEGLVAEGPGANPAEPEVVRVAPQPTSFTESVSMLWNLLSTPLASLSIVLVLVIFMLVEFEELRNRLLRLAGKSRFTLTTRTFDDVGRRISRFLMMNALVNGGFGLFVSAGLWVIGVDYAAFWGVLAALLRFVPYVGAVVAATLPLGMAIIQFTDWLHPLLAIGWFLTLEIVTNSIVEPLTYGKTAGVSTIALLVAATFWSWIWGPVGLLLSVPLTVVLAVLGKHIPQFEAMGILLGEDPALAPWEVFYQRLLAGDADEAAALVDEQRASRGLAHVYDEVLVPALSLAERDVQQGALDDSQREFVWESVRDFVEEHTAARPASNCDGHVRVVGCAARNPADDLVLGMLQESISRDCDFLAVRADLMVSEKLAEVARDVPDAVLISAIAPGGTSHVRYLCKRIRQDHPRLRIIVGRWGYQGDRERLTANLRSLGADHVVLDLAGAIDALDRVPAIPLSA